MDVIMPQMGESIAEGTIVKWLKKPGDAVVKDEPLFEISTDKVDAEIPAPESGVLAEILVPEGNTVGVNTVVARIGGAGRAPAPAKPAAAKPVATPVPAKPVATPPVSAPAIAPTPQAAKPAASPPAPRTPVPPPAPPASRPPPSSMTSLIVFSRSSFLQARATCRLTKA
jgi:2-oxoglutarate dehydrogenase E2 component (dihydrolipoamide succinyltransferase)